VNPAPQVDDHGAPGAGSHDGGSYTYGRVQESRPPHTGHVHTDRCHGYGVDHFIFIYPRAPYSPYYHGERYSDPQSHVQRPPLDRQGTVSVTLGVTGLHSGYDGVNGGVSDSWSDAGAGLAIEVRPTPGFGVEVGLVGYSDGADPDSFRQHTAVQLSAIGYALPDFPVSPYALVGASYVPRDVDDAFWNGETTENYQANSPAVGPHVGLGLEFALGRHVLLDVEGRAIGYLGHPSEDPSLPGALQTTVALGVIF